jgi:cell division ATPase FtsA
MDGVVGLDIGSDTITVAVLAGDGQELCRRWEIANSEAGGHGALSPAGTACG